MTVLASGSKGNSTVIASAETRVLVDAGLSCRELLKRMAMANEDPAALDAILITHEHPDHVAGLSVLARGCAFRCTSASRPTAPGCGR